MKKRGGYTYLLASRRNGTIYTGVTVQVEGRTLQHQKWYAQTFTGRYKVNRLVYYEFHESILDAIVREKRIKKWNRAWKIELIEKDNPNWDDLAEAWEA